MWYVTLSLHFKLKSENISIVGFTSLLQVLSLYELCVLHSWMRRVNDNFLTNVKDVHG